MATRTPPGKTVETLTHEGATRKYIPTAEYQSLMVKEDQSPVRLAYERRNRDLDPQLVWRGKDEQDWSDLVVHAPPLFIQEKVHPKVLIDDLLRRTESERQSAEEGLDLFADFNGLPDENAVTEFYQHDANWTNRMILGDSLQVMASLAEREGLRGKVQCIYIDPPYGIKFNSNFQWSTASRDVKDGNAAHITRDPEQVKAFRDTWRDGIHSYLTYLRDRLTVARDLLTDSGSIFVQIGDENVHRVRALMDEVFGEDNFQSQIAFAKTSGQTDNRLASVGDHILWYSRDSARTKFRSVLKSRSAAMEDRFKLVITERGAIHVYSEELEEDLAIQGIGYKVFSDADITKASPGTKFEFVHEGRSFVSGSRYWGTDYPRLDRLGSAGRLFITGGGKLRFVRCQTDSATQSVGNNWFDLAGSVQSRNDPKVYVVQTGTAVIQRCLLMTTDPGDLILDPTCGSGTTAYVAEQWGRRWITIDTSRVALALARARIMGARYPYYLLGDSIEGQRKEGEVTRTAPSSQPTRGDIRHGFVYERVPHITMKSIANNAEIDIVWEKWRGTLELLREQLNAELDQQWQDWEIPRESGSGWSGSAKKLHTDWWDARIARQKEIDASIAAKAEFEFLYDRPYEDRKKVRVAGPFTVESLSPHRVLAVDENDELIEGQGHGASDDGGEQGFVQMILENLKTSGVQQAHKEDKIDFSSLTPWPGNLICAEGRFIEGTDGSGTEKRAGIFIGPEFGTVSRPDLVAAAREAGDADFDVLITCAFNYDAHSSEFSKLGRIPVLKARMNADLHMADDLKNTGKGNLFVIFGEPDIDILDAEDGQVRVKINGVDVFHPNTGEVRSDGPEGIACWFIDTDYNEESFFVRHAYFLGANDPYKALKTTLKAEINEEAWETLNSDTSRPFPKPKNGRIAVKVINHLGDEVMKVFRVGVS
jgi:adenine-specific DNA-methyltransferase